MSSFQPFYVLLTYGYLLLNGICADSSSLKDVCTNITVSAVDCAGDPYSFSPQHSPCSLLETASTSVTLWQEFVISVPIEYNCSEDLSASNCMLSFTTQWSRVRNLSRTVHFQTYTSTVRTDNNVQEVIVNASLTLSNIEDQPDTDSEYEVLLSVDNCTGVSHLAGKFSLEVFEPRCAQDLPAPMEDYLNFTFEESVQCPVFVYFTGGRQNRPYAFSWRNSNNQTICSTAGVTNTFGRYTCGWTVNDRETCNHTVWLVIHNCSSTDAGNYTIRITDGQPAHVLLSFQNVKETFLTFERTLSISVTSSVLLVGGLSAIVIFTLCLLRRRSDRVTATTNINIQANNGGQEVMTTTTSQSVVVTGGPEHFTIQQNVWNVTINLSKQLTTDDFLHIAEKIVHWQGMARHMGLSEPDIAEIEQNYIRNYKEQKYQMLLKWYQRQEPPPTRQSLLQIIEVKMKDPALARDVIDVLHSSDVERKLSKL